jgi:transposase
MKKKKRYLRDESLYNKIQESEFPNFFEFVKYLSLYVCKTKRMRNAIVCLLIWRKFKDLSARRAKGLLVFLRSFKVISVNIPCFKTLCNYQEDFALSRVLDELIEESSKPLSKIEHDFATDSTGIRTKLFSTWYSLRCKKRIEKRDHLTVHTSVGVKSKTVAAINVEMKKGKDNIILRKHVDKVSENFMINEWSGDGAYWAKENCRKVSEKGGKPYFRGKTGKTAWNGKQSGIPAWGNMNQEYLDNPEDYDTHYHKRSNVETGNQMKKMLFGDKAYCKLSSSRRNEEILKWINHNINVLNRAKHEWSITPEFMA